MPLPLTHKKGTVVEMRYEDRLVGILRVTNITRHRTRDKEVTFLFKNKKNGEQPKPYSIRGEQKVKPMENSPPPMNQLEVYINQKRPLNGEKISLYYDAPKTRKISRTTN